MSKEPVPQDPGVEVERVPVLRAKEVWVLEVGAAELVRGHGEWWVAHRLREYQLGALVEGAGRRSLVAVH